MDNHSGQKSALPPAHRDVLAAFPYAPKRRVSACNARGPRRPKHLGLSLPPASPRRPLRNQPHHLNDVFQVQRHWHSNDLLENPSLHPTETRRPSALQAQSHLSASQEFVSTSYPPRPIRSVSPVPSASKTDRAGHPTSPTSDRSTPLTLLHQQTASPVHSCLQWISFATCCSSSPWTNTQGPPTPRTLP